MILKIISQGVPMKCSKKAKTYDEKPIRKPQRKKEKLQRKVGHVERL